MIRLGLTGTAGSVRYGILFRSARQVFLQVPDQARREVWGEWTSGWTSLRSAIGQQWNNVIEDSPRPRLEQTSGKFGVAWKRPVWPEITLTYAHNSLNSTLEPFGIAPQRNYSHSLESALAYNGSGWNARLASTYIFGNYLLRGGAEYTVKMQTFTATVRPLDPLTISPTLGYRDEVRDWSGAESIRTRHRLLCSTGRVLRYCSTRWATTPEYARAMDSLIRCTWVEEEGLHGISRNHGDGQR